MMKITLSNTIAFLKITLVILAILTIITVINIRREEQYDNQYLSYASELRVLTQRIAKRVGEIAAIGSEPSYTELAQRRDQFDKIINILIKGEYVQGTLVLPPSPTHIQQTTLAKVVESWKNTKPSIDFILSNQAYIMSAQQLNANLQSKIQKVTEQYWEILTNIEASTDAKNSVETIVNIAHQLGDMAIFSENIRILLTLTIPEPNIEKEIPTKVNEFLKKASNIHIINPDRKTSILLDEINVELTMIQQYINEAVRTGQILDQVYYATEKVLKDNVNFLNDATALYNSYFEVNQHRSGMHTVINILGALSILVLILIGYLLNYQGRRDLITTETKNQKINQDVETLLLELSDLANGNLGIKATANSGITKEIANSINYAVKALRKLVLHINETAKEASTMTIETQKLTTDLASASEKQAKEIIEATNSVQTMAKLAETVFNHANESALVAKQSVTMASEGGQGVRDTINGMIRIQSQIRATAAKVTRLNDSSQEIGQIISLINSIAEQTNILSLNASIQAAMAGDAGLGFAVVADEIQKLSEKVGFATREIETLIKSIRADTREVISSMEQTQTEVKDGGALAFNAGRVLESIELVSNDLAKNIQSISVSAAEQKSMSSNIASVMKIVEDIAQQVASSSVNTADLITKLTSLVASLRSSASEFKLPS